MRGKCEIYARNLLASQVCTVPDRRNRDLIDQARYMDTCIRRNWHVKLASMPIDRRNGFLNKVHNYALKQLP